MLSGGAPQNAILYTLVKRGYSSRSLSFSRILRERSHRESQGLGCVPCASSHIITVFFKIRIPFDRAVTSPTRQDYEAGLLEYFLGRRRPLQLLPPQQLLFEIRKRLLTLGLRCVVQMAQDLQRNLVCIIEGMCLWVEK